MANHLFMVRVYGARKKVEAWAVESILCDEFKVFHGAKDGLRAQRSSKGESFVDLIGEFLRDIPHEQGVFDFVPHIRSMVYRAAERYVRVEVEAYRIDGGPVYTGSELEFAKMKKDGLLNADLGEMEEFDG